MENKKDTFYIQNDFTKCNVKITEKSHTKRNAKDTMKAEKKMNKKEKEAYIGYGNKLKEFRENMGLTQDDVIDIICMHPNVNYGLATRESISRLECGKRKGILPYRRFEQTLIKIKENKYYEKLQNRNS